MKQLALQTLTALSLTWSASAFADPDPKSLLLDSDRARGGAGSGVSWEVKVESQEGKRSTSTVYRLRARDNNAHAEVIEPPRSKGEVILFNDRTLWFHKPSLAKPIAISARQKLSGQAANGDIASTNYARDYSGKIVGNEKLDGQDCYVLELEAKGKDTTYDRIRYWISKAKRLGLKAEFQSLEGKALKVATFAYGNDVKTKGKSYPFVSEMRITDARNEQNVSTLTYSKPEFGDIPTSLFSVSTLGRN